MIGVWMSWRRVGLCLVSVALLWAVGAVAALAAPSGGKVVAGRGDFHPSGNGVTQQTSKLIIDWDTFSIDEGETFTFDQKSRDWVVLNRVTGGVPSEIMGNLVADGHVFLINNQGILFGPNSNVNVASLLASTLDFGNDDLLYGLMPWRFTGTHRNLRVDEFPLVNQGTISAAKGGYVALLGQRVLNEGTIVADEGTVALAAGLWVNVFVGAGGFLEVETELMPGTYQVAQNVTGTIQADGGRVILSGSHVEPGFPGFLNEVVNVDGIVRARAIDGKEGRIFLSAGGTGHVNVGALYGAYLESGHVEVNGSNISMIPSGTINAGHVTMKAANEIKVWGGAKFGMTPVDGATSLNVVAGEKVDWDGQVTYTSTPAVSEVLFDAPVVTLGDTPGKIELASPGATRSTITFANSTGKPASLLVNDVLVADEVVITGGGGGSIDLTGGVDADAIRLHRGGELTDVKVMVEDPGGKRTPLVEVYGADGVGSTATLKTLQVSAPNSLRWRGKVDSQGEVHIVAGESLTVEDAPGAESSIDSTARIILASRSSVFRNHTSYDNVLFPGSGRVLIFSATDRDGFNLGGLEFAEELGFVEEFGVSYADFELGNWTPAKNTIYIHDGGSPILEITAGDLEKVYDATRLSLDGVPVSLSGSDPTLDGIQLRIDGGNGVDAGTYSIVPYGAQSSTYRLKFIPGKLTIDPAPIKIVVPNVKHVYGDPFSVPSIADIVGLKGADTVADLIARSGLTPTSDVNERTNVGVYKWKVTASNPDALKNYTFDPVKDVEGTIEVDRRLMLIVLHDLQMELGMKDPYTRKPLMPTPTYDLRNIASFHQIKDFENFITVTLPKVTSSGRYPIDDLTIDWNAPIFSNYVVLYEPAVLTVHEPGNFEWYIEEGFKKLTKGWCGPALFVSSPGEIACIGPQATWGGFPVQAWPVVARVIARKLTPSGPLTYERFFGGFEMITIWDKETVATVVIDVLMEILKKPESQLDEAERSFVETIANAVRNERIRRAEAKVAAFNRELPQLDSRYNRPNLTMMFDYHYGRYNDALEELSQAFDPITYEALQTLAKESPDLIRQAVHHLAN